MHAQNLRTVLLDYTHYVDLWSINGQLITFVMGKSAEPNVFSVDQQHNGDLVQQIEDLNTKGG
jgi:hypothetical protein